MLKDAAPEGLQILAAIPEKLPEKVADMQKVQTIKCVWAAQELQHPDLLKLFAGEEMLCPGEPGSSLYERAS